MNNALSKSYRRHLCVHPHTYRFSFYSSEHCPSFLCASVYVCKCYIFVPQPQTAPDVTAKVEDFTPFSHEFTIDGIFFLFIHLSSPYQFFKHTDIHLPDFVLSLSFSCQNNSNMAGIWFSLYIYLFHLRNVDKAFRLIQRIFYNKNTHTHSWKRARKYGANACQKTRSEPLKIQIYGSC